MSQRNTATNTSNSNDTIHRRATWLNGNVFIDKPINLSSIRALMTLNIARALYLLQLLEERSSQLRDPNGYLMTAINHEHAQATAAAREDEWSFSIIHRRATWLNANLFLDNPISRQAILTMHNIGIPHALELFKEIEKKADHLRSPSGYLIKAVVNFNWNKVHRRVTWSNAHVFIDCPINSEATEALSSLATDQAFSILSRADKAANNIGDPSNYLKVAASRALLGTPTAFNKSEEGRSWKPIA